ncbi:MAG TPA: DNA glycosylase [Candidatus Methylacidiphilales bacterium]|nr:DNA glycosylase [Candidatus Methylacidiphilales bacterium]
MSGPDTPFRPDLPQVSFSLYAHGLDLDQTLTSGQSFSWKKTAEGHWRGWIDRKPCLVWSQGDALRAVGPGLTSGEVSRYFGLDVPMPEIFSTFPNDQWLDRARAFAPGLRILRQEPWETLCNFICSSLKQIVQIEQINHELRRVFGDPVGEGLHSFPEPARMALATETQLRECRLGFRARHLYVAARQVVASEVSLERIESMPTPQARETLMRIQGVGEKVANCILLFAYGRLEAFPIDVWVERVLRQLYFKGNPRVSHKRLRDFAEAHFGPCRGYAQQFLFHWIRNDPKALPPEKAKRVASKRPKRAVKTGENKATNG